MRGQGHDGINGGERGDIYLRLSVKPHPYFRRQGDDLVLELPVTYLDAVLGGEITVPTWDGELSIRMPTGTQNHSRFVVPGHGFFKSPRSKRRGNLVVITNIKVPARLQRADKSLLQDLQAQTTFKINRSQITEL